METLMLVAIVIDGGAVAVLLWLLRRTARERDAGLAAQREALERLCTDLAQLVETAETRTRALDEALARREARLRALLDAGDGRTPSPRETLDPAEARLRRQLAASRRIDPLVA